MDTTSRNCADTLFAELINFVAVVGDAAAAAAATRYVLLHLFFRNLIFAHFDTSTERMSVKLKVNLTYQYLFIHTHTHTHPHDEQ